MTYNDCHQGAVEWLRLMHDRLHMCNQATGDKHSVSNRAEHVKVRWNEIYRFLRVFFGCFWPIKNVLGRIDMRTHERKE